MGRKFGRIREISLKNGFCFVEFDDYRDADDACYEMNGRDLLGDRVTVEIARGTPHGRDREKWGTGGGGGGRDSRGSRDSRRDDRGGGGRDRGGRDRPVWLDKYGPPTRTEYRVIVENLSSRVSWQDLKDFMRSAGEVTYADAHKSARNEGVVEFARYDDVLNAIEKLDDTELNGRRIKIIDDSRKKGRSRSRTRSRTRSRSRSRRGRSRSGSAKKSHSRSRTRDSVKREKEEKSRSRSKSQSKSRQKSGSPAMKEEKSGSRSRSRSKTGGSGDREMKSRSRSAQSRSRSRSGSP